MSEIIKFNPNAPDLILPDLILTDSAIKHFQKMLNQTAGAIGIRFDVKKTGCSGYSYLSEVMMEKHPSDLPIESIKNLSVWMTEKARPLINGVMIDYQTQGLGQSKLIYTNPNETARCGCGVSFSVDKTPGEAL